MSGCNQLVLHPYAKGFAATSEKVCVAVCSKMLTACFKSHGYPHSKLILRETLKNEQRKDAILFAVRTKTLIVLTGDSVRSIRGLRADPEATKLLPDCRRFRSKSAGNRDPTWRRYVW